MLLFLIHFSVLLVAAPFANTGPNTLNTIRESISNSFPVVTIAGSGQIADLLEKWEGSTDTQRDELLEQFQKKTKDREPKENRKHQLDYICGKRKGLLRVFDPKRSSSHDLLPLIFQVLQDNPKLSADSKLLLGIKWNVPEKVKALLDMNDIYYNHRTEYLDPNLLLYSACNDFGDILLHLMRNGYDITRLDALVMLEFWLGLPEGKNDRSLVDAPTESTNQSQGIIAGLQHAADHMCGKRRYGYHFSSGEQWSEGKPNKLNWEVFEQITPKWKSWQDVRTSQMMSDQIRDDKVKFAKDMLELDQAKTGHDILSDSSRLPRTYRSFIGVHIHQAIKIMDNSPKSGCQLSYTHRLAWALLTDRMKVADSIWRSMSNPFEGAFLASFLCRQLSQQNFYKKEYYDRFVKQYDGRALAMFEELNSILVETNLNGDRQIKMEMFLFDPLGPVEESYGGSEEHKLRHEALSFFGIDPAVATTNRIDLALASENDMFLAHHIVQVRQQTQTL
jgi:hypothetical protein